MSGREYNYDCNDDCNDDCSDDAEEDEFTELLFGGDNRNLPDDSYTSGSKNSSEDTDWGEMLSDTTLLYLDPNRLKTTLSEYCQGYLGWYRLYDSKHDNSREWYSLSWNKTSKNEFCEALLEFLNSANSQHGKSSPTGLHNVRLDVLFTVMSYYSLPRVDTFYLGDVHVELDSMRHAYRSKCSRVKKTSSEVAEDMRSHPRYCTCYHHTRYGDGSSTDCSSNEDNDFHYKTVTKYSGSRYYASVTLTWAKYPSPFVLGLLRGWRTKGGNCFPMLSRDVFEYLLSFVNTAVY
jgi:hypothetical protein